MTDLYKMHERVVKQTAVSFEEMTAAATAISRQPRESWADLVSMLGLDGKPVTLNTAAKVRYARSQARAEE
jgi:hypothetical protein